MNAFKKIFPTLDFEMIAFYVDDTLKLNKHPAHARHPPLLIRDGSQNVCGLLTHFAG